MRARSVTDLIGKTPLLHIESNIWAKCEFKNPGGSVKDRIALAMIEAAIKEGRLKPQTPIVEPTSGNTGIAIAMIAAAKGFEAIIVMPESMSVERRKLMEFLGAKVILTPANLGMSGAIQKAKELAQKGAFMLSQFENPNNPKAHEETTGKELIEDLPDIDIFVAGVGTGGTVTGVGRRLKAHNPSIKVVAVEPARSPVLSGGKPHPHKIQGIGAGFIPKILDTSIFCEVVPIEDDEAIRTSRELARTKGIMAGISSGANIAAARKLTQKYPEATIATILCDTAERYLSTDLFE